MSISIIILKEIDGFSCEDTLHSIQQAAAKANLHCVKVETVKYFDCLRQTDAEYLSGYISEVDAETLKSNFEKGIHSEQFGFDIEPPTDISYNSFTWLIKKNNYFGAGDLQYISEYFRLRENINDYLWIDDTDWYYSAEEMIWLSTQPYTPEWPYRKLTAT